MKHITNILIVDDDRDIRNIIRTVLDEGNRHILDAANVTEAMQSIELTCPDIILLDIGLQGPVDGLSFYETIAGNMKFRKTKVIIVSGSESTKQIEKARNLGVAVYLKKPFSPLKLASLVSYLESKDMFVIPPVSDERDVFSYDELLGFE